MCAAGTPSGEERAPPAEPASSRARQVATLMAMTAAMATATPTIRVSPARAKAIAADRVIGVAITASRPSQRKPAGWSEARSVTMDERSSAGPLLER